MIPKQLISFRGKWCEPAQDLPRVPTLQQRFWPDPQPLVERLGREFFRNLPERPGVYLMRDASEIVLYVGKAKNLRRRLGSYRVANPERMPRRHLRLLRAVIRIELQECADERAALAREAELLRTLKPRFNRAGTWPGTPRFLAWRSGEDFVEFSPLTAPAPDWNLSGPLGTGAFYLGASLARLLWLALHPAQSVSQLPPGWGENRRTAPVLIRNAGSPAERIPQAATKLAALFAGDAEAFSEWIQECRTPAASSFEQAWLEAELESLREWF